MLKQCLMVGPENAYWRRRLPSTTTVTVPRQHRHRPNKPRYHKNLPRPHYPSRRTQSLCQHHHPAFLHFLISPCHFPAVWWWTMYGITVPAILSTTNSHSHLTRPPFPGLRSEGTRSWASVRRRIPTDRCMRQWDRSQGTTNCTSRRSDRCTPCYLDLWRMNNSPTTNWRHAAMRKRLI